MHKIPAVAVALALASILGAAALGGCARKERSPSTPTRAEPASSPAETGLHAARLRFRAEQDATMRGELSPLARVDYVHLPLGQHTTVTTSGGTLSLDPALLMERQVLTLGRVRLLVTGMPDDPGVAVYDPEAKARREYAALVYFPDDERYVVTARLTRYESPRTVRLDASRGEPRPMQALGVLHFSIAGTPCSMEAYAEAPGTPQLFLIFKDQSNGKPDGSYGAGRFLHAQLQPGDQVLLDFNQAWNPLCAYSHYFHCPLPPKQNWLPVAIPAGERAYPAH